MQKGMSALPPKADICSAQADVCFVPIADIQSNQVTLLRRVLLKYSSLISCSEKCIERIRIGAKFPVIFGGGLYVEFVCASLLLPAIHAKPLQVAQCGRVIVCKFLGVYPKRHKHFLQKVSGIGALGGQGSKFIRAYAEIVGDLCNLIRAAVYQFAASSIRLAVSVDPVGNCAENFFKAGIWWIANHLIQSSILLQYGLCGLWRFDINQTGSPSCTVQRQGQAKVRYFPNSGHRAACRYRDRRLTFM
ncbi:MAG: hypothetical protein WBX77_07175 [Pseudolabrys sp.]